MKNGLLFLLKLLVISLALFLCLDVLKGGYQYIEVRVASLFIPAVRQTIPLDYTSYLRTIPFIALVLATPKLGWRRRLIGLAVGLAVYIGLDVLGVVLWGTFPTRQTTAPHIIFTLAWKVSGQWILPFLLWFLIAGRELDGIFTAAPGPAGKK